MITKKSLFQLLLCTYVLIANNAIASTTYSYSFEQITNNGSTGLTNQLSMVIEEEVDESVSFTFYNDVGIDSSIAQVYFDDSSEPMLTGVNFDSQSFGVIFDEDGSSGNIGTNYEFDTTYTSKKEGSSTNGVDTSGEWVKFSGELSAGITFESFLMGVGDLFNTALHVISIGESENDVSEKFVLNTSGGPIITIDGVVVPIPAALWLLGPVLLGFISFRRKIKE